MSNLPAPVVKAFLICDQVIHDMQTGKKTLVGVFHEVRADRFPAVHPILWIYANLTNARGRSAIQIRLIDVANNHVLGSGQPPPLDIKGPLGTTEIAAQLRNVTLPQPGTYEFQLLVNDELIATKAIRASPVEDAQQPFGEPPPET